MIWRSIGGVERAGGEYAIIFLLCGTVFVLSAIFDEYLLQHLPCVIPWGIGF
jgi:hypothetical protein